LKLEYSKTLFHLTSDSILLAKLFLEIVSFDLDFYTPSCFVAATKLQQSIELVLKTTQKSSFPQQSERCDNSTTGTEMKMELRT
jgi:hypothetical protein